MIACRPHLVKPTPGRLGISGDVRYGWVAIIQWLGRERVLNGNDPANTRSCIRLQATAAVLVMPDGLLGRYWVPIQTDFLQAWLRPGPVDAGARADVTVFP
jgi:hypothetical protein